MTSILSSILGGSEEQSKTKDITPVELRGVRTPFAETLLRLIGFDPTITEGKKGPLVTGGEFGGETLGGIPQFGQPFAAGITEQELATLGLLPGAAAGGEPLSAARDLLTRTLGGGFTGEGNPFLRSTIEAAQRPTLEGLEEVLSRVLPGRFTQGGQFTQPQGSSAFDRAAAIATRGTAQALADIATNISFGAHEAERGRQQEAVGIASDLTSADVQRTISTLQAQALPRFIEQFGIDQGLKEFQSRMTAIIQVLSILGGTAQAQPGTQASQTSQTGVLPALGSIFSVGFGGTGT